MLALGMYASSQTLSMLKSLLQQEFHYLFLVSPLEDDMTRRLFYVGPDIIQAQSL
jgi:hypothetical protein